MKKLYALYDADCTMIALYRLNKTEKDLIDSIFMNMANYESYFGWEFREVTDIYETKEN